MAEDAGGHGLVRLGIRVRRERAEQALGALLPLLAAGTEETEPEPGVVEYALYAPAAELPRDEEIRALAGDDVVGVVRREVAPGWERRWHEHLRPVEVAAGARRLRIRPPWSPAGGDDGALELVIDPGEQFGAGTHPTTQLCLELLAEAEPGGALCDWGAGSGILAVAAARLGFGPVSAVEHAPGAAALIAANAAANGVRVDVTEADLTAGEPPWAPTVTANVPLEVLERVPVGRIPERLIVSGVLADRVDGVALALGRHGLAEAERRIYGDWGAVVLAGA